MYSHGCLKIIVVAIIFNFYFIVCIDVIIILKNFKIKLEYFFTFLDILIVKILSMF